MDKFGRLGVDAAALLVAVCLVATSAQATPPSEAPPPTRYTTLRDHVLPALGQATPAVTPKAEATDQPLALTVVLRRSDTAGFQVYLRDVYDSKSPQFRKFLSPIEVTARFGPSEQDYDMVRSYFESIGFTLGEGSANRMTLILNGTRQTAERALALNINDYRIGEKKFRANDVDPTLPEEIAQRVEAITGLSDLAAPTARPQPMLDHLPDNNFNRALWYGLCANYAVNGGISAATGELALFEAVFLEEVAILNLLNSLVSIAQASDLSSSGTGAQYAKCVNQYNRKYGYSLIGGGDPPPPAWQGADGTGQTVGLLEFDTFQMSDVANYIALMGQASGPLGNVSQVHVNGGATPGASQDEVVLDIDDVLTAAPGAKIKVFDAPFTGAGTSFQGVLNAMINGGVTIISNSWGYCEDQTTLADVQSIDIILQTAAASGISVFTGAGDHGSTCLDGSANTALVPATSPHITAVGGTSSQQYPGFTYGTETWWDASADSPPGGQGGFGVSKFFARPSYQDAVSGAVMRSIPDVSANADPKQGVMICLQGAGGCPTYAFYGGTSSAAPTWAAFAALLNQTQGSNLGFFNPLIYPFASTNAFHDAASMGSDFAHVGLGSPNLARLHQHLTGQPTGAVSPSVSMLRAFAQTGISLTQGATLPLPSYADGATQTFVVVTLADSNGIPVGGKTIALSSGGSNAVIIPATAKSNADTGVALFAVTDTTIETVTITATDTTDGVALDAHPRIQFFSPPATGGSISASPSPVASDGVSTTTITVTLQNGKGQGAQNKVVTLSQASGHSVITGPVPAVTDSNGQVVFTATDGVSETVVYTAVDVTDDNQTVPGSASVVFTGGNTSCVGALPTPAAGYAIAPWANGFFAQNFFFGNVNWSGCPGVSNPTFSPSGSAFVTDFRTGDLFSFGMDGGAAAGHTLTNLGLTLGQPTYGKDGRLYATHAATTGNFTTGDLVEIDPTTGAQLRVVVSNLTCAGGLTVDPLSGDLFFDDQCTGAGSDNPSIWRVHDPVGGTPTMTVYATLPNTPNGGLSFSPDGTLYAVTGYFNNPSAPIIRISGTGQPQPPTLTTMAGVTTDYGVAVAQALPNGTVKSFMVHSNGVLQLVDVTTLPFTVTPLANGTISPAVIGPDGCLYAGASDSIYKLTPATGGCGFLPTNPSPTLSLTPATVAPSPAQGGTQTFTATFKNVSVSTGTPVLFTVSGANARLMVAGTDASGAATITYTGVLGGTDTVTATATAGTSSLVSNPATVTWLAGKHTTFLDLSTSPSGGLLAQPLTVSAALADATLNPLAVISGATIHFTLGSQSCDGVTGSNGVATCSITPSNGGQLILSASYAGSAVYVSAAALQDFGVVSPAGATPSAPTIDGVTAGDGSITIAFSPPSSDGGSPITSYTVACAPAGGPTTTVSGPKSPIKVSSLVNGVAYTCTVSAANASGPGPASSPSTAVAPASRAAGAAPIPALEPALQIALSLLLGLFAGLALRSRRSARK